MEILEYPKIPTVWQRDWKTKKIVPGAYSTEWCRRLQANPMILTEKIDGTNTRVYINPHNNTFQILGRRESSKLPEEALSALANHFDYFRCSGDGFGEFICAEQILFLETYGGSIQKGAYEGDVKFAVFDVYSHHMGYWAFLNFDSACEIAEMFDLPSVPVLGHGTIQEACDRVQKGQQSRLRDGHAEGIVMRSPIELATNNRQRIIAKIKERDYARM